MQNELQALINNGIIRNTRRGYVSVPYKVDGYWYEFEHTIGYYSTRNGKIYVEDSLVDIARELLNS